MHKINKILIIRLTSLGDIILTTPVIKAIRHKFHDATIYYLTKTKYKELLDANPYIDEILCIETIHGIKGIYNLFKVISILKKRKIDLVIDLYFTHWSYIRNTLWSFLLRHLIGAKNKIKCYRPPLGFVLYQHGRGKHVNDFYFEALRKVGVDSDDRTPELFLLPQAKERARNYLNYHGVEDNNLLVGICPGGSWHTKQWGEKNFREICNRLSRKSKIKLILFGNKSEKDLIKVICKDIDLDKLIYAIELPLREVISLIGTCKVLLTNDSGLMHIASALKVPVIAIFGPTHPKLGYYPLGKNNTILYSDIHCSPCSRWGEKECKYKKQLCFEDIKVENVFNEISKLLQ